MSDVSKDPSVFDEPHLRGKPFEVDPREDRAAENLGYEREGSPPSESAEHAVWDEPGLSVELTGPPPKDASTYAKWLEEGGARTTLSKSWLTAFLLALAAGPWAIFGTFYTGQRTILLIAAIVVFGPAIEEMMKIGAALYVVEKRPFLFKTRAQIALCALAGGFAFATIENLLYLSVYIDEPSAAMTAWRWTVCTSLHMGCSAIAGMGLMRAWLDVRKRRAPARLPIAFPYIITAVVIHGSYNALAVILSAARFQF